MKKLLIIFGILDIITLIKSFGYWNRLIERFEVSWLDSLSILFYFSLVISVIWLFKNKSKGLTIYYFQFPFRIGLAIFSFGFLMPMSRLFENHGFGLQVLSIVCLILEISRLIASIIIHRKMRIID
ncbi:MAG: hypothetical protein GXO85_00515 [Chlorobi bacterium]|nr:hypothetical protein [Chlorobiota bacterium]